MTGESISVLASLASMGKTVSELLRAKGSAERQTLLEEFQRALNHAHGETSTYQKQHAALVEEVADLKKEVMRLKEWSAERSRYRLVSAGTSGMVYAAKKPADLAYEPHYLCATCYDRTQKAILHVKSGASHPAWACPLCKTEIQCLGRGHPTPKYAPQ